MAKTTNQKIQNQISSAGKNVSYKEASAVAQKLGVTVDRVYNQTAKTGQGAVAGAAAANAGYVPTDQLKVSNPVSPGYISAAVKNATATSPGGFTLNSGNESPGNSPGLIGSNPGVQPSNAAPVPQFDWDAWNAQMSQQQAAIWASMDAMNAQFLQQQQAWMESQKSQQQVPARGVNTFGSLGSSSDKAQVKRQKAKKRSASTTNPVLGIGSGGAGSGVSLGGSSSGSTLGVG